MQTIKVTVTEKNGSTQFTLAGFPIAETWQVNGIRYSAIRREVSPGGCDNHKHQSLPAAVEFISDAICSHFAQVGFNVEYVEAE